jgi:hypothetical protein
MYEYYDSVESAAAQGLENKRVNLGLTPLPEPVISGLKLNADVSIGDLTLNTTDSAGVVWVLSDIEGWWTLPDSESPELRRGWGDGDYDAIGRYSARLLTLSGSFLTQDPSQVAVARDRLIRATNLVKTGNWLVVRESPIEKASFVRLSGSPQIETTSARGRTNFSIGFKAADPIKYEWLDGAADNYRSSGLSASGSAINNEGNTYVSTVIQVFGPITASVASPATVTLASGGSVKIVESLTSGQILEIDSLNREVLLVEGDSVLSGRYKTATLIDWIYLAPGVNTVTYTGGGSCRMLYRSGWIG